MFAQLEPAANPRATSRDLVDADVTGTPGVGAHPADHAAPLSAPLTTGPAPSAFAQSEAQATAAEEARANSAPWPAWTAWSTEPATPTGADATADPSATPQAAPDTPVAASPGVSASASGATERASGSATTSPAEAPGVTTLEALERGFAASGFQQFTAQPGALAALAAESAHGASPPETPTAPRMARIDAPDGAAGASPPIEAHEMSGGVAAGEALTTPPTDGGALAELADAAPPDEPAAPAPTGPDPKDYAARLELARRKRSEGALDDAFVEYTAVLRNAPDLVPEVMRDLESLSDDEAAHPEAHRLLGDARIRQGDYMSALASLNRATALTQAQEQGEG